MQSLEGFAEAVDRADCVDTLSRLAATVIEDAGFTAFLFSLSGEWDDGLIAHFDFNYLSVYFSERLYLVDPVRKAMNCSWLPIAWDARDYLEPGSDSARIFRLGLDCGYERGISVPIHGPFGRHSSLVGIFAGERQALFNAQRRLGHDLMGIGLHLAAACHRLAAAAGESLCLTLRERECLEWTAHGKTAWEISRILVLAERTVNFHLQNAMAKLDAPNKHQAVQRAMQLGLVGIGASDFSHPISARSGGRSH